MVHFLMKDVHLHRSAMLVNHFKMRSDVVSYNLGGMGCSAGVIAIGLADIRQQRRSKEQKHEYNGSKDDQRTWKSSHRRRPEVGIKGEWQGFPLSYTRM